MPFSFEPTEISDVILIKPRVFTDARGFILEIYKHSDFAEHGIVTDFVQANHSHSTQGVLRGLHYQKHPRAQGKLVGVAQGAIFDVAVDIRKGSPTYGKWVGRTLSVDNHHLLYIPPGFAHGFCTLTPHADLIYQMTDEYSAEHERGILWNDPDIGIAWPIQDPILSSRDKLQPGLRDADNNAIYQA